MIQMSSPPATLPWLRLSNNTNVAFNSSTSVQQVSFDTVSGSGNGWPTVTPVVTTITLPFTGLLRVTVHDVDFQDAVNAVGFRAVSLRLRQNVAANRRLESHTPNSVASPYSTVLSGSAIFGTRNGGSTNNAAVFDAGDVMEVMIIQSSGVTLTMNVADVFLEYMAIGNYPFSGVN